MQISSAEIGTRFDAPADISAAGVDPADAATNPATSVISLLRGILVELTLIRVILTEDGGRTSTT